MGIMNGNPKQKYNDKIMERLNPSLDRILPLGSVALVIMAIIVLKNAPNNPLIFADLFIAAILMVFYLLRKRLAPNIKIAMLVLILTGFSIFILFQSGLSGTGILVLVIGNFFSYMYLRPLFSYIVTGVSVLVLFALGAFSGFESAVFTDHTIEYASQSTAWILSGLTLGTIVLMIGRMLKSLKDYLMETILELESQLLTSKSTNEQLSRSHKQVLQTQAKIAKLAYYDPMTDLPNRNMFRRHIKDRIDVRPEHGRAKLLLLDIRSFKLLNSVSGTYVGDQVLKVVAGAISKRVGENIFAARLGGNEFGIWVESPDEENIMDIMESIIDEIHKDNGELSGHKLRFYMSYTEFPAHGTDFDELYQNCCLAMKEAKENPNTEVVPFSERIYEKHIKNDELRLLVEQAIERDEFIMYYQKKIDAISDQVTGVEALVRWISPTLGFVAPGRFIAFIEKSNLNIQFGNMVLRKVFVDSPSLISRFGDEIKISINISPFHLIAEGFCEYLMSSLQEFHLDPKNFIIEITEGVMMDDYENAINVLNQIRGIGLEISLDDFGTGYSSLSYLTSLPINELKIDKTFIDNIIDDEGARIVVHSIITIAKTYGFEIVAEGVETEEQVRMLKLLGCNTIQGYVYSKPEPI